MLSAKVSYILKQRGMVATPEDIELRDVGVGPFISRWNEARLGPKPTPEDLAAVADADALAAERELRRERELALRAIKALAIATHKRLRQVVPTDATTAQQWENAIRAEWDNLNA